MAMTTGDSAGTLGSTASTAAARSAPPPHTLPDEPLFIIQPSKSWAALDVRALWSYRELLYFLTLRDVKVRYKQTALGVVWVVMQPLLTTLVLTVFLGMLVRVPSDDIPYPLFTFSGLLLWTFFTGAVTAGGMSVVGNSHLVTKVYFPRIIVPVAAVGARLVDFAVAFLILVGMLAYYRTGPTWHLALLPIPLALVVALALALGVGASALNVKYRDVGVVVPVLLQLGMFVSPVAYPPSLVPENWRWLYSLNPMVGVIENFRACLFGRGFNWPTLAVSAAITLAALAASVYAFRRLESEFADAI